MLITASEKHTGYINTKDKEGLLDVNDAFQSLLRACHPWTVGSNLDPESNGKQRPETKLWALQVDLIKGNQPKNLRQRIRVGRERGEDQVKKDFPERHNEQDEGWEQRAGFGVLLGPALPPFPECLPCNRHCVSSSMCKSH